MTKGTVKTILSASLVATIFLFQTFSHVSTGQTLNKPQSPSVLTSQVSAETDEGNTPEKPQPPVISAKFPYQSKFVEVLGSQMHYVEQGDGDPILFLHGIPTSSYLWRNVLPLVKAQGRAIAVDNIGFGKSDKPNIDYSFYNQARYLEGFIEALNLKNVTLIVHDWGAAFGLHYAWQHQNNVKGIAFMEGVMTPTYPRKTYASFGKAEKMFRAFRDRVQGPELIVKQNFFVEKWLPSSVMRDLSPMEIKVYRDPFVEPEARRSILRLIQDNPIEGKPADVVKTFNEMTAWWLQSDMPKLMIYASPGRIMPPETAAWAAENLKNIETLFVGNGIHFIQEDHPEVIGRGIADWYRRSFQNN
jgi:haloalkane dehalogenase